MDFLKTENLGQVCRSQRLGRPALRFPWHLRLLRRHPGPKQTRQNDSLGDHQILGMGQGAPADTAPLQLPPGDSIQLPPPALVNGLQPRDQRAGPVVSLDCDGREGVHSFSCLSRRLQPATHRLAFSRGLSHSGKNCRLRPYRDQFGTNDQSPRLRVDEVRASRWTIFGDRDRREGRSVSTGRRVEGACRRRPLGPLLALTLGTGFAAGCTHLPRPTLSGHWNPVPSLVWRESSRAVQQQPPKVTANASGVTAAVVSEKDSEAGHDPPLPGIAHLGSSVEPDPVDDPFLTVAEAPQLPVSDARVQQLKEALSADAQREAQPADGIAGQNSLRLRIDALIRKAMQQEEEGQLLEAQSTAQRAVDLADAGQVEFLPTEERPSDFLHRVTNALRQAGAAVTSDARTVKVAGLPTEPPVVPVAIQQVDAREALPAGSWRLSGREDLAVTGRVAANRPMNPVVTPTATAGGPASVELPATINLPSEPLPASPPRLSIDRKWPQEPTSTDLATPERAPAPPVIDPLEPLPKFQSPHRPAEAEAMAELDQIPLPGTGLRGWSLWGPVLSLSAILGILGGGLLLRDVRDHCRRKSS